MARIILSVAIVIYFKTACFGGEVPISNDSSICIDCHASIHPGMVEDWKKSRHAAFTPADGMKKSKLKKIQAAFPQYEIVGISAKKGKNMDAFYEALFVIAS